jgi:hypothetical protein
MRPGGFRLILARASIRSRDARYLSPKARGLRCRPWIRLRLRQVLQLESAAIPAQLALGRPDAIDEHGIEAGTAIDGAFPVFKPSYRFAAPGHGASCATNSAAQGYALRPPSPRRFVSILRGHVMPLAAARLHRVFSRGAAKGFTGILQVASGEDAQK